MKQFTEFMRETFWLDDKPVNNGAYRAAVRLGAHKAAQAERLKDAVEPTLSRQVSRRNSLMMMKRHQQNEAKDRLQLPLTVRMGVSA